MEYTIKLVMTDKELKTLQEAIKRYGENNKKEQNRCADIWDIIDRQVQRENGKAN